MRWSRLRYLLCTSRGPVGAAPIAATISYAVLSHLTWWRGDWVWGYNNLGQTVPVLMLVTAFVVGWDSGSPSSGYSAMVDRVPASRLRVSVTLLAPPLGLALGLYTVGLIGVVAATWSGGGVIDARAPLLISSHLLMICVAATVGLQLGRVLTSPYAALASAALIGLALFVHVGTGQRIFELAGTAGPAAGTTQATRYFAENLATLFVVALALGAPLAIAKCSRVGIGCGVALALGAFATTSLTGSTEQFVGSSERPSRCAGIDIEVCVYPGYDRSLPVVVGRLSGFLDKAAAAGVPPATFPARFLQLDAVSPGPDTGALHLDMYALRDAELDPFALAQTLTASVWCAALFGEAPPVGLLKRGTLVGYWVQYVDGALSKRSLADVEPRFARLGQEQQAARIIEAMEELRRCDNS